MKNKFIKLTALFTLLATVLLCFAACGGQEIAADDDGKWSKDITWEFKQSNQTLTIEGTGNMANATLKEVSETKTDWVAIRSSVKRIVIDDGITGIGNYAFHGMTALESVTFSASITKIGKCAFAFCASLKEINLPASLDSIGESAFEGCYSLEKVKLPTSLITLGDRAFAFCRNLKTVLIPSEITSLNHWTFKDCTALKTVAINAKVKSNIKEAYKTAQGDKFTESGFKKYFEDIYADAFEGSSTANSSQITFAQNVGETEISVWRKIDGEIYEKDNGKAYKVEKKAFGDKYSYNAPAIDGYVLDTSKSKETVSGMVIDLGETKDITFHYKKAEAPKPAATTDNKTDNTTDKPTEESEGVSTGTIIALCIFGVVIVGVIVGATIVIRSDKKGNKSTTVRKNTNNTKKK